MGLFDFLAGDPAKRAEKAIAKAVKVLTNPFGPTENRQKAVETLMGMGTPEALLGVLRRFTINTHNGIIDEDEKAQVFEAIVERGEAAVDPIRRYLEAYDNVTQPLRILSAIVPPARAAAIIIEVLQRIGTEYVRVPEKKVELIAQLGRLLQGARADAGAEAPSEQLPDIVGAALPFLGDVDDDVRLVAIDLVCSANDPRARAPVIDTLLDGDTSPRIRNDIAEHLARSEWEVTPHVADLAPVQEALPDRYRLEHGRVIRRR
jgi:hypothetical protein